MTDGPLRVGDVVHGHVDGYFGRDHYDCARVEAFGADWVVIRTFDGTAWTGSGAGIVAELEKARSARPTGFEGEHSSGCPGGGR
jgi:hypothetical protein